MYSSDDSWKLLDKGGAMNMTVYECVCVGGGDFPAVFGRSSVALFYFIFWNIIVDFIGHCVQCRLFREIIK